MPDQTKSRSVLVESALDHFWETIPPLWGYIRAYIRAVATENFEISVEQFHILRFINRGYGSVSELADARNISRPSISKGVDSLVQRGLVKRAQNQEDRRRVELSLTERGSALLESVFQDTRAWMQTSLVTLSREELESAILGMTVLQKLIGQPE